MPSVVLRHLCIVTNVVDHDGQITEHRHDGDCKFDATFLTCVSYKVSPTSGETGLTRTCPNANVSDLLNQIMRDGNKLENVPGLHKHKKLNNHQNVP